MRRHGSKERLTGDGDCARRTTQSPHSTGPLHKHRCTMNPRPTSESPDRQVVTSSSCCGHCCCVFFFFLHKANRNNNDKDISILPCLCFTIKTVITHTPRTDRHDWNRTSSIVILILREGDLGRFLQTEERVWQCLTSYGRFSDDYRGGGWPDCLKKCGRGGTTDVNYIV